jgi:hypothetical protein
MIEVRTEERNIRAKNRLGPTELAYLRAKINDRDYLYEAIESLAVVLSNEILNIPQGGLYSEWEGGE